MQALPTVHSQLVSDAPSRVVAVVASDDLALRRICDTVAMADIEIAEIALDVEELTDAAGDADLLILAGTTSAAQRRTLIHRIAERFESLPVVLVATGSGNSLHKAIDAGAAGIVGDDEIESALAPTVAAVAVGQCVVPRALRRHATRPALSHRERQTLALLVSGLTNRQIASRLFLAESTVKTHLSSIFAKLGVGSRSEAVALVLDPDQKLGLGILGLSSEPLLTTTNGGHRQ